MHANIVNCKENKYFYCSIIFMLFRTIQINNSVCIDLFLVLQLQVRAGEALMKLVTDIKQYLILNDFPSVNDAILQNSHLFKQKQLECDRKLMTLRDDMAADLYDLEEEYYSSTFK